MPFEILLTDTWKYLTLSKIEVKILDTIRAEKTGNAYSLWKASHLKHYPTVLRTLKKLEKKGLVKGSGRRGARGERIYTSTLSGILASLLCNKKEKEIVDVLSDRSVLFRELINVENDEEKVSWVLSITRCIITHAYKREELRNIDAVIKEELEKRLADYTLNIDLEESIERITILSKSERIRKVVIEAIDDEIDRLTMNIVKLRKLKGD